MMLLQLMMMMMMVIVMMMTRNLTMSKQVIREMGLVGKVVTLGP